MDDRASPAEGNSTATEPRRKLVKRFFGGLFDLQSRQSRAISQQQSYATSANTQPTLSTLPGISTVPVPTMSTSSSVATTAALQPPTILPLSTPSQSQPRLTRDSHRRDILATLEREFPLCDPRFIHCLWRHPHFTSMDPASAAEAIRSKLSEMAGMYPQRTPVQPLPSNGHCDITSDKFRLSSDGQMLFAKDGRILHANTAHLNFSLYQLNEMFPDCDVTHLKDIVKITAEYPLEHTIAHLLAYECNCDGIEGNHSYMQHYDSRSGRMDGGLLDQTGIGRWLDSSQLWNRVTKMFPWISNQRSSRSRSATGGYLDDSDSDSDEESDEDIDGKFNQANKDRHHLKLRKELRRRPVYPRRLQQGHGILTTADFFKTPTYIEGAVQRLQMTFPDMSKTTLQTILAECGFDYVQASLQIRDERQSNTRSTVNNAAISDNETYTVPQKAARAPWWRRIVSFDKRNPQLSSTSSSTTSTTTAVATTTTVTSSSIMSTPVPTPMITPAMFDLDLLHDVERLEKALLDRQIERDAEYAHVINNEEYEETEQGLVCSCCDGAQSFELSAQCCDGHIFCKDCLVSYVTQSVHGSLTVNQSQSAASDSAISSGAVTCFSTSGCQSLIPVSELSRLLPKPLLQSHLDATAQRSLIDAGLDVARCPFCSYFEAVSAHPTGIWDNINGVRFSIVIAAAVLVLLMCLALVGMVVVYSPILWASSGVASQVSVIAVPLFDFGVIGLVIGATWFFGSGRRHAWIRLQARAKYLAGAKARAASRAPPRYHLDGPTPFDISTVSEGSGPVSWLQWLQCALSFTSSGYLCSAVSTSPISPGDSSSSSTSSSPSTMQDGKTLEAEDESNGALFHCKNPSCCRTSCMLCDRMFSAGHRCIDDGVDALRLHIERTMTEIVKRTCPQCGLSFVRSSGCNKMTCRCGYVMCYLCRQDIKQESYQHYCQHFRETPGTKCTECAKCELYGTIDEDAQIRAAAEQAREEFMLKWGTQMSVKTQKQQFHRTMALQNRTAVADAFVQQHVIGSNGNATLGERIDMAIESTIDPILTFILS